MTMAVNHLAHMLLTDELYPLLQATEKSRIINVASMGHKGFPGSLSEKQVRIDINDVFDEKIKFDSLAIYLKSKFANVMFTRALARVVIQEPQGMKTASLHPGVVGTPLYRDLSCFQHFLNVTIMKPFYMTEFEGAQNNIMTCNMDFMKLQNGVYYDGMKVGRMNPNTDSEHY